VAFNSPARNQIFVFGRFVNEGLAGLQPSRMAGQFPPLPLGSLEVTLPNVDRISLTNRSDAEISSVVCFSRSRIVCDALECRILFGDLSSCQ
jgi:hypothetical protein